MNLFELIRESLNESKQVGLLYHYTTPGGWWEIEDCDCLRSGEVHPFEKTPPFISTTRNKNFHLLPSFDTGLGLSSSGSPTVRLTLDGDKLSQRYKIQPHNYFSKDDDEPMTPKDKYYLDEYEERIYTKYIQGLKSKGYLLEVVDVEDGKELWSR